MFNPIKNKEGGFGRYHKYTVPLFGVVIYLVFLLNEYIEYGDRVWSHLISLEHAIFFLVVPLSVFAGNLLSYREGVNKDFAKKIKELGDASAVLSKRESELEKVNTVLEESSKAKTQFVSVAAHQLKTPLASIKWAFQMLLSEDFGPLNDEQKEVLERGKAVNEQIIRLVSDLLDVAKIESGRFVYDFSPFDLKVFLEDVKNLYVEKAEEEKKIFEIQVPKEGEVEINGDSKRVFMVFQNLIDNAFKYTPKGGSIKVFYEIKRGNGVIQFNVKDTGVGIDEEDKVRLFEKFFRGKGADKMEADGTGLGLFISQKFVKGHGGNIWVDSKEGEGSTFSFTLPIVVK